jgi:hypothetical protein
MRRDIARNHAPRTDYAALPNRHSAQNDGARSNPGAARNFQRSVEVGSMASNELFRIEFGIDQHAAGGKNHVISDFYSAAGVQENAVINCTIPSYRNPPVIDCCEISKNEDAAAEQEESLCLIEPPR